MKVTLADPVTQGKIKALCQIWRSVSRGYNLWLLKTNSDLGKNKGRRLLQKYWRLKKDKNVYADQLRKDFRYKSDPYNGKLNVIRSPWHVALTRSGDCDCVANFIRHAMGGQYWIFMDKLGNDDSVGHVVLVDKDEHLWSWDQNGLYHADCGFTPEWVASFGDKFVKDWKVLVNINKGIYTQRNSVWFRG